MCRSKELGGRRCPQHTDPVKHAAYNARRRELYAAKKTPSSTQNYLKHFIPFDEVRPDVATHLESGEKFLAESKAFNLTINPGYAGDLWKLTTRLNSFDGSESEHKALLSYTQATFKSINRALTGKDVTAGDTVLSADVVLDNYKHDIANIDSALAKAETPDEPRLLYRGLRVPTGVEGAGKWVEERFPVGGTVSQKSYMSTTMSSAIAMSKFADKHTAQTGADHSPVIIEIVSKKGAPLGEGTSVYVNEEVEILVPRESRFKVVSVDHDVQLEAKYSASKFFKVYPQANRKGTYTVVRLVDEEQI
jgi:hypothetical protein